MAVSKRLRYEILRRDDYTCRYCKTAEPGCGLTVDHVVPTALGGTDEPSNLVAACSDCNGGKTSSSPDAPLVADVAGDAVRWATAMKAAQAKMLADISTRDASRAQFADWWNEWGYGAGFSEKFPMPGDWEQTVDQLLAAGLPLRVLKDCVERAMTRKGVGDKFRYMCGVAWKKVAELREAAHSLTGAESTDGDEEDDPYTSEQHEARRELACEILGIFGEDACEWYLDDVRSHVGADDPYVEEFAASGAVFQTARAYTALRELFNATDGSSDWITVAARLLTEKHGPIFSDARLYDVAARVGLQDLKDRATEQA